MEIAIPERNRKIRSEDREERFVLPTSGTAPSRPAIYKYRRRSNPSLSMHSRTSDGTFCSHISTNPQHPPFPFRTPPHTIRTELQPSRKIMPLSGEAIRLMNYIDDVA